MSQENKAIEVVLHIDEAKTPLVRGQRVSGTVIAMVPESRPPSKRDGVLQPGKDAPSFLRGSSLYVTPRYGTETWADFVSGKAITVNVTLVDSQKKELARGIGTLERVEAGSNVRQ